LDAIVRGVEAYEAGRLTADQLRLIFDNTIAKSPEVRDAALHYIHTLQARGRLLDFTPPAPTSTPDAETLLTSGNVAGSTVRLDDSATELRSSTAVRSDEEATRLATERIDRPNPESEWREAPTGDEPLLPGMCLRGRYLLELKIGQGAMGQVWKAKDLLAEEARDKHPYVAIKVLHGEVARHPEAFAVMHREASRTQKLAHPNIVTVFNLDRDDASGRAIIAMELLEGEPLDRLIERNRRRPLPRKDLQAIVRGLADGLAYAHKRGIIHSDFKPGNVFVLRDGTPKILDFGIARAVQVGEAASDAAEDDSILSGYTETYASPQVLEMQPGLAVDDVFALGLVIYELYTSEHPYERKAATLARAEDMVPRRIKELTRAEWRAVEKALAFERPQRWQDAGKFGEAWQKRIGLKVALGVTLVALAATAGGLSYKNHLDALPAVPFEQLPAEIQRRVSSDLDEGNDALRVVRDGHVIEASADAADRFADAYALHPRNPDAVKGLEAAAGYFIDWALMQPDRERMQVELAKFRDKSEYYQGYAPLERASRKLAER
jgi:hypothetical protein